MEQEQAAEQEEEAIVDPTNAQYATELVMTTLTMSDLDELKPFVIDSMILEAAAGNLEYMSPQEVANMMMKKLEIIYENQSALDIDYTMDELIQGQHYWVNTTLERPINGIVNPQ